MDWRRAPRKRYNLRQLMQGEATFVAGDDHQTLKRLRWATRIDEQRSGRYYTIVEAVDGDRRGYLVTYTGTRGETLGVYRQPASKVRDLPKRPVGRRTLYPWETLPIDKVVYIPADGMEQAGALFRSLCAWASKSDQRFHAQVTGRGDRWGLQVMLSSLPKHGVANGPIVGWDAPPVYDDRGERVTVSDEERVARRKRYEETGQI